MGKFMEYIVERENWAEGMIKGSNLAADLLKAVARGKISLNHSNNVYRANIKGGGALDIILKPTSNNENKVLKGNKAVYIAPGTLQGEEIKRPQIRLYIFNLLNMQNEIKGKSNMALNDMLKKFVQNNYTSSLISAFQHEINHALEEHSGIETFTAKSTYKPEDKSKMEKYRAYINKLEEVHSAIVESASPINEIWAKSLKQGKWKIQFGNKRVVNKEVRKILGATKAFRSNYTGLNNRKFIRGIYTTLAYLWDHYTKKDREREFSKPLIKDDLDAYLKTLGI